MSYLVVYSTMTIDGRIASKKRYSKLSCPYDLKRLHKLRAESDGIMVGANTVIIDDPSLRVKFVRGKNPTRIVVDGLLRTPISSRVYTLKTAKTIVLTTNSAPKDKVEALKRLGVEVIKFQDKPPIDMNVGIKELYNRGLKKIMVEGGGELLWYLFKDDLVNELRVTISPYIFGGKDSVSLVMGEGFLTTKDARKLKLIDVRICECKEELHVRYKVIG
jgi:2,5-diamino-6-(ribosylamino)-4(3H)-pyrimidinone 5'-phosphate reductase